MFFVNIIVKRQFAKMPLVDITHEGRLSSNIGFLHVFKLCFGDVRSLLLMDYLAMDNMKQIAQGFVLFCRNKQNTMCNIVRLWTDEAENSSGLI